MGNSFSQLCQLFQSHFSVRSVVLGGGGCPVFEAGYLIE